MFASGYWHGEAVVSVSVWRGRKVSMPSHKEGIFKRGREINGERSQAKMNFAISLCMLWAKIILFSKGSARLPTIICPATEAGLLNSRSLNGVQWSWDY